MRPVQSCPHDRSHPARNPGRGERGRCGGRPIARGILALIGVRQGDTEAAADRLLERIVGYRIFPDAQGRMNVSLQGGRTAGCCWYPSSRSRLTLAPACARASPPPPHRMRASACSTTWLSAPARRSAPCRPATFGAHMQVSLVNDGPVTFWLETPPTGDRSRRELNDFEGRHYRGLRHTSARRRTGNAFWRIIPSRSEPAEIARMMPGWKELLIILLVVLVVFGAKKLQDDRLRSRRGGSWLQEVHERRRHGRAAEAAQAR